LRNITLEGRAFDVAALPTIREQPGVEKSDATWAGWCLAAAAIGLLLYRPARRLLEKWRANWNSPEAVAARQVDSACKANDARRAYTAMLAWRRSVASDGTRWLPDRYLEEEWDRLSAHIYSGGGDPAPWTGQPLRKAFANMRKNQTRQQRRTVPSLPALNPQLQSPALRR
jgi:hypothetical protein